MTRSAGIWKIMLIGCSMVAYFIGAGFSSGQEILQFFVTYGDRFLSAVAGTALLIIWSSVSYARSGSRYKFKSQRDVLYYYCGQRLGAFFDIFNPIYCYSFVFYMVSAAAIVANTTFGAPKIAGAIVLSVSVIVTVMLGFNTVAKIMGYLGMVNIALLLIVTLYTLLTNMRNIPAGIELVMSGSAGIFRSGPDNPFLAGAAYIGSCVIWFSVFISQMGLRMPSLQVKKGALLGSCMIVAMIVLSALAMFSVLPEIAAADIPNLIMANKITPLAGFFFTLVIMLEIYNTTAPLIWTTANRIAPDERSAKFRIAVVVLMLCGAALAMLFPYKVLVGYTLACGGYVCYLLFAAIVVKDIRSWLFGGRKRCP